MRVAGESWLANLLAQRDIAIGDLADEGWIWVEQHDMEMLHGFDRFEGSPVFEPCVLHNMVSHA